MKTLFHWLLAGGMLITGSINTLLTELADQQCPLDRYGYTDVQFNHPFVQAAAMFIGEMLCIFAFYFLRWRARTAGTPFEEAKPFSPFIFLLPAMCDMTATSTMYLGLSLTDASIFQMLRGSVVIFTSIFSVVFLKRKLRAYHWLGVVLVLAGAAIVGAQSKLSVCEKFQPTSCSSLTTASGGNTAIVGNVLIIAAQIIVAVQMVVEEKFISGYNVPALQVVGYEGIFGFTVLSFVLMLMYVVPGSHRPGFLCTAYDSNGQLDPDHNHLCDHFEDTYDAFIQFGHSAVLRTAIVGSIFSIAFFNYFGVSVTKHISAATRMVLDSMRTIIIWAVSLGVGWEKFCWVQIIGFLVLLAGMIIYNGLIQIPGLSYEEAPSGDAKTSPLLDADDADARLVDASSTSLNDGAAASLLESGASAPGGDALVSFEVLTNTPAMRRTMALKAK